MRVSFGRLVGCAAPVALALTSAIPDPPAPALAPVPTSAEIRLSTGVRLRYMEQGDPAGHPVILLHGYSDSWFSWSRVLPLLPGSLRVYALDQRGHGESDRPASGYGMADLGADVVAFMEAKGIERATVVGHSMGSFVAQQVAAAAPDRIAGLMLVGAGSTLPKHEGIVELWKVIHELTDPVPPEFVREFQTSTVQRPVPPEFMDGVVRESLRLPARVWRGLADGMSALAPAQIDPRIRTMIVWGDADQVFPADAQGALRAAIPGAAFTVYTGTGHAPHWEEPERFAKDVATFAAEAAGRR